MELLDISAAPGLLTLIGALALLTSVITELTKGWGVLSRIPTDAQVLVTAQLLSLAHLAQGGFSWQQLPCALAAGCLAAFIAMYGWATFWDLSARFSGREQGHD